MNTLTEMVDHLLGTSILQSPAIVKAFTEVDREQFVPEKYRSRAYEDKALPIGHKQTISQPYTVAFMLELLQAQPGDRILDVGSGSGYTTALLAHIVGSTGHVIGVEIVPELVDFGRKNLAASGIPNAEIRSAGPTLGLPDEAPFDKILVSAAADTLPDSLINQLKPGGRMVIPIRQSIWKIEKEPNGSVHSTKHDGFIFVPLIE